jgi:AcrR family transcriptional regulator
MGVPSVHVDPPGRMNMIQAIWNRSIPWYIRDLSGSSIWLFTLRQYYRKVLALEYRRTLPGTLFGRLRTVMVRMKTQPIASTPQGRMQTAGRTLTRRNPKQQRSRQTVDYVLEAVPVVVKRHGAQALTTNRIAEAAGVSVGSLYQYFPNKRAIFTALYDRHVEEVQRIIEQTMTDCATAPLDDFARELVLGLVNAHTEVPELHDVVTSAVPLGALGFKNALHQTFGQAISRAEDPERYSLDTTERMLFVLPGMVESLVHGGARAKLSHDGAKGEAVRAVQVYMNSFQRGALRYY